MFEALIVFGLLVLLVGAGWAALLFEWQMIAAVGIAIALAGLLLGLPTGFYYHVVLHRFLAPRGVLPPGWYWAPARHHRHLEPHERRRVFVWFYAGAAGFVLIMLGCAVVLLGVVVARR